MKFNWGYGILIVIMFFIAAILTLVYKCTKQNIDLVSNNYYEQELKYDQQMEKEKNNLTLSENIKVGYNDTTKSVVFHYPSTSDKLTGNITFFKPDDARLDFNKPILCDNSLTQTISSLQMKKGWWKVKINWKNGELAYYYQQDLYIN
jgi:hypothetical protein